MRLELITTGTELMLGFTQNSHPAWLARQLAVIGVRISRQTAVADDRIEMRAALADAVARSDVVLMTGGLGPTSDDFTRDVAAELWNRKLSRDESVAAAIRERFAKRNLRMPDSVMAQAMVPEGARVLVNRNGTASGLAMEQDGKLLVLLPGPPRELQPMVTEYVIPMLQQRWPDSRPFECRVFKLAGMAESLIEERVAPVMRDLPDVELGYCARMGEVEVRIVSADPARADIAERNIRSVLGDNIYGMNDDRLEDVVVRQLTAAGLTLAVAESCTGGLITHRLTNVSGASAVLMAGYVTYANDAKMRDLGVTRETLAQYGAVGEPTAREMAEGARRRTGANLGLSVTGIAGPTGGTPEKPVGLVFIGLATATATVARRHVLLFDRETFKFFTSQLALELIRRELIGKH